MSFETDLLEHYHLTMKDLDLRCRPGSFSRLSRPYDLPSFKKVIGRLDEAIHKKEKTILYGDYDVDGLTSTAIMKIALDEKGLVPGFFTPNRYKEGYGLNTDRVKQFAQKGYHLIVCVDNGVSAKEAVNTAHSLGMEVIAIDHHEIPKADIAPLDALFHDQESGFLKSYHCSAASLAYFVASYLLGRDDEYLATLAGLAVFSDVMPLVENNLEFAKIALDSLNKNKYSNLVMLCEKESFNYDDILFKINPSLNAIGRVEKEELATINATRFLLSPSDKVKNITRCQHILQVYQKRKDIVKNIPFDKSKELSSEHGFVTCVSSYSGLTGLFAGKLLRDKKIPVLVLAPEDQNPDLLVGSIRAPRGYHFDTFLTKHKNLFIASGGHERACGITFPENKFFQVATAFLTECEGQALEKKEEKDDAIPLTIEDLTFEHYAFYEKFFPFGEGFEAPKFSLTLPSQAFSFSPSGKLAYSFSSNGEGKVVAFSSFDKIQQKELLTCEGSLGFDTYQGKKQVVFRIEDIKEN